MVQAAILARQHGERRVVAHRAHRLFRLFRHWLQDQLEILKAPAERRLPPAQLVASELRRLAATRADQTVEHDDVLDPLAVGPRRRQPILDLLVAVKTPIGEIDADHLARAETTFLDDRGLVQAYHS